ncbi:hypothetical protein KG112_07200 [Nocardioides sp. zg-ZUI104]|uniref:hypothetical protein n=1 Tax=Nocardioides faecalis TaxID=2803858 RepID=UPI001BCC452C|nr:hypothetical protein [Nocardioides faecalis]MBS4752594.1 hypothetical protein [Nocardioides faecalis]
MPTASGPSPAAPGVPAPPRATRVSRPGWRDPRLWIGVVLVAGSVVLGARLLDAADDTVAVWVLEADRGSGTPLSSADLRAQRVRFADDAVLERYFSADAPLPDGLALIRAVGAGELLARSAVGQVDAAQVVQVPLEVDPNRVPPDVVAGSVVDVWITDGAGAGAQVPPLTGERDEDTARGDSGRTPPTPGSPGGPALSEVTVVAAPSYDDTFAVTGARQLVVAVEEERAAEFERLLGALQDPVIRILQRS